jgi:transcriptional regulator GlxA family with amidase domain
MIQVWVYDGILASGVAGPVDVFTAANKIIEMNAAEARIPARLIRWCLQSLDGRPIETASGQTIMVDGKIGARGAADAVLVTAPFISDLDSFIRNREQVQELCALLRRQHKAGATLATYCTGSYLLAEAGLLDGRIATTHWGKSRDFTKRYPRVELRSHEVLTEQDHIICGGAVTSFLDVALRLVALFSGRQVAALTAKLLLIDPGRTSQSPYADLFRNNGHTDELVAKAQGRMEASLQQKFSLSRLAADLAVSERTLNRRFKHATGQAPLEYLQSLRIEVAKRLLEAGSATPSAASLHVGYSDFSTFRLLFKRKVGVSPSEYQRRFTTGQHTADGSV